MERIEKLSIPKKDLGPKSKTYQTTEPLTKVAKSSLTYDVSERIQGLAAPVQRRVRAKFSPNDPSAEAITDGQDVEYVDIFTYTIPQSYRKVKSRGYVKLAEPKPLRLRKKYVKVENAPDRIDKRVLKSRASERTKNLAKEKKDFSEAPKADPFVVPKKALVMPGKKQAIYLARLATPRNPIEKVKWFLLLVDMLIVPNRHLCSSCKYIFNNYNW